MSNILPKGWSKYGVFDNEKAQQLCIAMDCIFHFEPGEHFINLQRSLKQAFDVREHLQKKSCSPYFGDYDPKANAIKKCYNELYIYDLLPDSDGDNTQINVEGIIRASQNPFFKVLMKNEEEHIFESVRLKLENSLQQAGLKSIDEDPHYIISEFAGESIHRREKIKMVIARSAALDRIYQNYPDDKIFMDWIKDGFTQIQDALEFCERLVVVVVEWFQTAQKRYDIVYASGMWKLGQPWEDIP